MITIGQVMFSHPETSKPLGMLGEFGQKRIREDIVAGTTSRFNITAPTDRNMFIFRYRFGDITANALNFKWNNAENVVEQNILIGSELLNFDVRPYPFILCRNGGSSVIVQNTSGQDVTFEMVYDYILVHKESIERFSQAFKQGKMGMKSLIG